MRNFEICQHCPRLIKRFPNPLRTNMQIDLEFGCRRGFSDELPSYIISTYTESKFVMREIHEDCPYRLEHLVIGNKR